MLDALRRGKPIDAPVCVVAAHYDDETIGIGGAVHLFRDLTLMHMTDGGHPDPAVRERAGAADPDAYVEMRVRERSDALDRGGWQHAKQEQCHLPDRAVARMLPACWPKLRAALAAAAIVITHPYEGGHPDHDAVAYAVQKICQDMGTKAPERYEFASYFLGWQGRVAGQFCADAGSPEVSREIHGDALTRKQAAFAAYRSQAGVLRWFDPRKERYRKAPIYDFDKLPPPERCLYERKRFTTFAQWQAEIRSAA